MDQRVELHLLLTFPSLLADVADGRVESLLLPADLVTLTVFEGATEHRETDNVGMAGRMSERALAIDADE